MRAGFTLTLLALLHLTPAGLRAQDSAAFANLTPVQADSLLAADSTVVILDVRTPEEFHSDSGHLRAALLIPVHQLEDRIAELDPYRGKRILAYCHSGVRSAKAAAMLARHGFDVLNMIGGIVRWNEDRLPVVQEP